MNKKRAMTNVGKRNGKKKLNSVYRSACDYVKSGISLLPIRADGSKMPAFGILPQVWCEKAGRNKPTWKPFQKKRPSTSQVHAWFSDSGDDYGFAVLGGKVSGGLEIIDCDNWEVAERWCELVEKTQPGLLDRLIRVKTPRPGLHAYFRCSEYGGNQKLARIPDPDKENKKPKTIIELKGEGGYCLAPPSPAACHRRNKPYQFIGRKTLCDVATITPAEREILLECARKLNCWVDQSRSYSHQSTSIPPGSILRPGDDFNFRGNWADILEPHDWMCTSQQSDGTAHWRRPGKRSGSSATTNFAGSNGLFVFSSNAHPFEEWCFYSKFHAYTLLEHEGDFSAAASQLRSEGFGSTRGRQRAQAKNPYAKYAGFVVRPQNIKF